MTTREPRHAEARVQGNRIAYAGQSIMTAAILMTRGRLSQPAVRHAAAVRAIPSEVEKGGA